MTSQVNALSEIEFVSQVSIDASGTAFVRMERAVRRGSETLHSTCHRTTIMRGNDLSAFPAWVQSACHAAWSTMPETEVS